MVFKNRDLYALFTLIAIGLVGLMVSTTLLASRVNRLEEINKEKHTTQDYHKPESFGGVGYITEVNHEELYIDAVGYGRFNITADESQFLQVGDKLPTYIMIRGAH